MAIKLTTIEDIVRNKRGEQFVPTVEDVFGILQKGFKNLINAYYASYYFGLTQAETLELLTVENGPYSPKTLAEEAGIDPLDDPDKKITIFDFVSGKLAENPRFGYFTANVTDTVWDTSSSNFTSILEPGASEPKNGCKIGITCFFVDIAQNSGTNRLGGSANWSQATKRWDIYPDNEVVIDNDTIIDVDGKIAVALNLHNYGEDYGVVQKAPAGSENTSSSRGVAFGRNNQGADGYYGLLAGFDNLGIGQGADALGGENKVGVRYIPSSGSQVISNRTFNPTFVINDVSYGVDLSISPNGGLYNLTTGGLWVKFVDDADYFILDGITYTFVRNDVNSSNSEIISGIYYTLDGDDEANIWSLAAGEGNVVASRDVFVAGYKNTVSARSSAAVGLRLNVKSTLDSGRFAIGFNNVDKDDTLFEIGNGANSDNRSNAFEVTRLGIARAYGVPVGNNDLTPKNYVDGLFANLNIKNGDGDYSLVQKEAIGKEGQATGRGSIVFGGFRGDKPDSTPNSIPGDDASVNKLDQEAYNDTISKVSGIQSYVFGAGNRAYGDWNFIMGKDSKTCSRAAYIFGGKNYVGNPNDGNMYLHSMAVGSLNTINSTNSFAAGTENTITNSDGGMALGISNVVNAGGSDAIGISNTVNGAYSAAVGSNNIASGQYGTVLGVGNELQSTYNFALGVSNTVRGNYSGAFGVGLKTYWNKQYALGTYNDFNSDTVLEVGNGDDNSHRSNAFEVTRTGVARAYGTISDDNDLTPKSYVDSATALASQQEIAQVLADLVA